MTRGWDWGTGPEEQRRRVKWEAQQRAKGKDPGKGGCRAGVLKAAAITGLALAVRRVW